MSAGRAPEREYAARSRYRLPRAVSTELAGELGGSPQDVGTLCRRACLQRLFSDPLVTADAPTSVDHPATVANGAARLATMNMLLHGIGKPNGPSWVEVGDALAEPPYSYPSVVLSNPPFGRKSSVAVVGRDRRASHEEIGYTRHDFWAATNNQQLNRGPPLCGYTISALASNLHPDRTGFSASTSTISSRAIGPASLVTSAPRPNGLSHSAMTN